MKNVADDLIFRLMAERVQDYAIFVLDPKGCIASWNVGAARIKQYTAAEIIGKHFSIFYLPEDIERKWPEQELKRALMDGRFEDEGWRVRKDGSRFWANVVITALRDDHGKLLGYSKITRDLSERRRQEEVLRESEERFRLLVDGVLDYAIYMLSPEGVVTSWNMGARRITGYEAGEIIGRHFSLFYEPADVEAGKPWAELATARGQGRAEEEGWRVRNDGTRFWARVVVTSLHDASGTLRGFAKVTQDLTQRRRSESIEEAARRLNDFIAVLAHELRNPLAPIRSAVQVMTRIKPGQPEFEAVRRTIERQSAQLVRLVDDLLDVNRVTRGAMTMQHSRQDVRELVSIAVEAAQPGIDAARHTLELRIPEGEFFVDGDGVRLAQALTNILNNAARYTDPGGHIALSVRREGGERPMLEISVKDSGRGIEPEQLGAIFGMFVQGRGNTERAQSGLGVGLALARGILELHQGSLEARSEGLGRGSEFILRLPAADGGAAEARPARSMAGVKAMQEMKVRRILVVDDNVDAATTLATMLRAQGHVLLVVHGGAEALQAAEGFRPDIVMLDIGMPGMDGFEVARRLRERKTTPEPLIVAVTGWGNLEDEARGREAGIDLHLVKPVESGHLIELFEQMSGTRH